MRAALSAGAASGLPAGRLAMLERADEFARTLERVPVHLVVCVELGAIAVVDQGLPRVALTGGASIYPFVQNILLGLRAEQLGAAFTTLLVPAEAEVRELLGIPEGVALAGHIAVGQRADRWPSRLSRDPVSAFTFAERYGEPWRE